jgi:hypothetical protein
MVSSPVNDAAERYFRHAFNESTLYRMRPFVLGQCIKKESKLKSKVVAALLSGLVFPGAGQYYMGRRRRALALAVLAAVGGLLYLNYALDQASAVADQVLAGRVALDPAAIAAQIEGRPTPLAVTLGGVVFAVCWVGSVLEALLVRPRAR